MTPNSIATYYCAMSLDGYIAESDDTLDWLTKYEGSYAGADAQPSSYDRFMDRIGALVMGSATYEFVLDELPEWPYTGLPTWVLTTRDLPKVDDPNVRFAAAAVPDLYDEMMSAAGDRDLWVVGGGNVASQFADADLIDELILTVVPVVLGDGKPLFDRRLPHNPLKLVGTQASFNGMVQLRYRFER